MKLQPKTVLSKLTELCIFFQTSKSPDELSLMAELFYEVLEDEISDEQFVSAIKAHTKEGQYFPTVRDILVRKNNAYNFEVDENRRKWINSFKGWELHRGKTRQRFIESIKNCEHITATDKQKLLSRGDLNAIE
jgi:hypothetical protein